MIPSRAKSLVFSTTAVAVLVGCAQSKNIKNEERQPVPMDNSNNSCKISSSAPRGPGFDIIIVAGQSNSVGYGEGEATDAATLLNENDIVFQIGRKGLENFHVIPAGEPLAHWDVTFNDNQDRKGFALPFARRYAKRYLAKGRKIIIVPAGFGGTDLIQWNNWNDRNQAPDVATFLYDDMIARIHAALQATGDKGVFGQNRIVGFLWHQGESNLVALSSSQQTGANSSRSLRLIPDSQTYAKKLGRLIQTVRGQFVTEQGHFPVLIGEVVQGWLPTPNSMALKQEFKDELIHLASYLGCANFVHSDGLDGNGTPNDVHFSAAAQVELGNRYFDSYVKTLDQ